MELDEEYHDEETLKMAQSVMVSATSAVQCALNEFWTRNGQPSDRLIATLRSRLTDATRAELVRYFGASAGFEDPAP